MLIVNQAVVMEQSSFPGSIGDSCAESSRMLHLQMWLGNYILNLNLNQFVSPIGYIRHPDAPADWRETDFSGDQALPLYLAFSKYDLGRAAEMEKRLKGRGYKVGNGDYVSPGFFAALTGQKWLINLSTVAQALIFKLPYRYSESKKKLERTTDNSGDYLNWIHLALHGNKLARKSISKSVLKEKIREYYKPEPNNESIISLYDQVLEKYW